MSEEKQKAQIETAEKYYGKNPIASLLAENERLKEELAEQCRINGLGQQRELKLESENDQLKALLTQVSDKAYEIAISRLPCEILQDKAHALTNKIIAELQVMK
jgi:cell shape-determining protein MreC